MKGETTRRHPPSRVVKTKFISPRIVAEAFNVHAYGSCRVLCVAGEPKIRIHIILRKRLFELTGAFLFS